MARGAQRSLPPGGQWKAPLGDSSLPPLLSVSPVSPSRESANLRVILREPLKLAIDVRSDAGPWGLFPVTLSWCPGGQHPIFVVLGLAARMAGVKAEHRGGAWA